MNPTNAERYRRAHVELCYFCLGDKRVKRVTTREFHYDHIATDVIPCPTCNGRGYRITSIDALTQSDKTSQVLEREDN